MGYKKVDSSADIGGGVATEQFQNAVATVLRNIGDVATNAKGTRKITQTFTFSPSDDRCAVVVTVDTRCTLAPVKADEVTCLVEPDGLMSKTEDPSLQNELDFSTAKKAQGGEK